MYGGNLEAFASRDPGSDPVPDLGVARDGPAIEHYRNELVMGGNKDFAG